MEEELWTVASEFDVWLLDRGLVLPYYVYRHYAADNTLLYAGITNNLRNRLYDHYRQKAWIDQVSLIKYETVPDEATARKRETEIITTEFPVYNISQNEGVAGVVGYLQRMYDEKGCEEVMKTMKFLTTEEQD